MISLTEEKIKSIFNLSDFKVITLWKLENRYWGDSNIDLKNENPWWLVKTEHGLIEVGSRKRVYFIDWSETSYRGKISEDGTTMENYLIHAWSLEKLLEYLTVLRTRFI